MRSILLVLWLGIVSVSCIASEVRVATIQFESVDGAFVHNLETASEYVKTAREEGAEIVLLPEFALIGYELSSDMWANAESLHGRTAEALAALAKETGMYIGTSFLEVEAEHFYNTFILVNPNGEIAGKVRKQHPAGAEGYFFRGDENPHVIKTPIGDVGVGICQENYRCFLPQQLHKGGADFVLMPFSYPDLTSAGGLGSPKGRYVGVWYAKQLGVPIVTSNKTGYWPQVEGAFFPGFSAVVGADGSIIGELDDMPGVLTVEVSFDDSRKKVPSAECIGPFLTDLTLGSWLEKRITWATIWISELLNIDPNSKIHQAYASNSLRRKTALALSAQ